MNFRNLALVCTTAIVIPYAVAQSVSTGALVGQVIDPSGSAIVGAHIELQPAGGSSIKSLVSDQQGRFVLQGLPSGTYTIRVERSGFRDLRQSVTVNTGATQSLTLALPLSGLTQQVTVNAQSSLISESPTGQMRETVSREEYKDTPAITIGDVLALVPGVTSIQGNGPRDISLSIRGSNERQTFAVRNIQLFEDGFPVTQPDGTGRTDLTDPHAYSGIDVVEGPSSALYGNYATGGAINFHTRPGSDIHGLEIGVDFGSFGYFNDYASYGAGGDNYQVSAFVSNVRADQATANNQYNTITANILATVTVTPRDHLTFKFINNDLDTNLSLRLSLNQYKLNPLQHGCESFSNAAPGCGSASLFINGFNGAMQSVTAAEAGFGRHDRRTVTGGRYEHDLTSNTVWRTQFVWDNRNFNQPTSNTSSRGEYPSFNLISDVLRRASIHGRSSTTYAGGFFNYMNINSLSYNVVPGGDAKLGGLTQSVYGKVLNTGARARQEITLAERWTLVAGLGGEFTQLQATANNYSYPTSGAPTISPVPANRNFFNAAPEVAVQYRPTDAWLLHGRFGTGYGTPQATQLFVTPQGTFGNNSQLKTQRNYGIDFGAEWLLNSTLRASVTGFYEWFRNELVSQSAGVNLQTYSFNAPASAHRGLEAGLDWHMLSHALPGAKLRMSYQLDKQVYTNYTEVLAAGSFSNSFNRNGNNIPGVTPNFLNARIVYDQPSGRFSGFGAFIEANWRDNYHVDNANFLSAPGTTLLDLSTHYDPPTGHGMVSRLHFYFDIQNLANKTYVASANNITNSLSATSGQQNGASEMATATGSVYAGTPRSSSGGIRMRF